MTNKEKFKILDGIKLANNIFPIDEQDCREENAAKIADMEKIFDLRDSWDYSCLFALADFFVADKDKVEAIKKNLIEENSYDRNQVSEPDWNTKLLVSTALEDNPLFFSMAFNWINLCEYRVSKAVASITQDIISNLDAWKTIHEEPFSAEPQYAGKAGFKKFGSEHTIGKYGKIGQEGCIDKGLEGIIFYILLSEEYQNKNVSFKIEFTTLADGKEYPPVILKADSKKKIQSGKIKADISKGIRVTKISVKE